MKGQKLDSQMTYKFILQQNLLLALHIPVISY